MARAMRCEYHFVHQYCHPGLPEPPSAAGAAGSAFHEYRADYSNHLVAERKWRDPDWAFEWLNNHRVPDDAAFLIQADIERFSINPEKVFGAEVFLTSDRNFKAADLEFGVSHGARSDTAMLSGAIDLLIIDGEEAQIIDAKSAYASSSVSEQEAAIYCSLVFAHFPAVNRVIFSWDFVRLKSHKFSEYTREEFPAMREIVRELVDRRREIARRVGEGDSLSVDPWSGMCPYCTLVCPLTQEVTAESSARLVAIQDLPAARRAAASVYIAQRYLAHVTPMLRDFIAAREDLPGGQLDLGENFFAELAPITTRKLPVVEALHALGLGVVPITVLDDAQRAELLTLEPTATPLFDIPLARLEMRGSALKGFAKTKRSRAGVSREGLAEAIDAISPSIARGSRLQIRRADERAPMLEEGDEQ